MRLEEIVSDGFKSYSVRTVISGWDASFNAITGLNGTGKSNILDSIQLHTADRRSGLGAVDIDKLRVKTLTELIYKGGKAGVNKASVTLTFDNMDKARSPVGFETQDKVIVQRTIVMGQTVTSKYLINGHRATQEQVHNMFQSVQLNIKNPNFLIQQGQITKVLGMKPVMILSLIEEAAGTSMFEDRKEKAFKAIAKKEKKMEELQELIRSEINPKLEKLRNDKRNFLAHRQVVDKLELLTRIVTAHDWQLAVNRVQAHEDTMLANEEKSAAAKQEMKRMTVEITAMNAELAKIIKRREAESAAGGKVDKLDKQVNTLSKELAALTQRVKGLDKDYRAKQTAIAKLESSSGQLQEQHQARVTALAAMTERYDALLATHDTLATSLAQSEELLQTLTTGVSGAADSSSSGYMGQLASAKARVAQLGAEVEQTRVKIAHMTRELKDKEPRARQAQGDGAGLVDELERTRKDQARLEAELAKLGGAEAGAQDERLGAAHEAASALVKDLGRKRDGVRQQLGRLDFQYTDPVPGFDRSRVHGLVASQIRLKPQHASAATALEIAAGGRLYNVIVDDEAVGRQLLERGRLQSRVTIIPLTKISEDRARPETVAAAQRVAPGKVHLALDMIDADPKVRKAMSYVFGRVFICADAETAKRVAFHPDVRTRCVTLEGDVYNPSGTLEGGSAPQSARVLESVAQMHAIEAELARAQSELDRTEAAYAQAREGIERVTKARRAFAMKSHEVELLEQRMADSSATRIVTEVAELKAGIATLNQTAVEVAAKRKEAEAGCKRIEREMHEFKNNRESKLDQLKGEIKSKKAEVAKLTKQKLAMTQDVGQAKNDVDEAAQDIEKAAAQVVADRESLVEDAAELEAERAREAAKKTERDATQAELVKEQQALAEFDEEAESIRAVVTAKQASIGAQQAILSTIEAEVEKAGREAKAAKAQLKQLGKENPWIADDQDQFGVEGGQYDFAGQDMPEQRRVKAELEAQLKAHRGNVNDKVLNMIENAEKREAALKKNYETVRQDRIKIQNTITKLLEESRKKVRHVHERVSEDFGNIFGDLLPGNFARLVPVDEDDLAKGLEVRVRLGTVWKQSLTELSGGQRSLIALSLIMSLLQYSPAPMYILDEIDSALDLSHTQNIGHLFRTRFKGSQFIVVSLKEGLFTNANVLYRTKFRDNTSVVERTAQRSGSDLYGQRTTSGGRRIGSG